MRTTFLLVTLLSLSTRVTAQVGAVIGSSYHNVTARYNSYFIANERIKEIEQKIFDQYQWNYNDLLPIYAQYDTTTSRSLETELQDCIEKASIAIQRHPESRWEDNAYVLVGKARMYGSEFPEAIETFKWVNKFGDNKDSQHEALSQLIRTFTEAQEYRNAVAVIDYLKNERLSDQNMRLYYQNRAYYYQKRENFEEMAVNLIVAEEYFEKNADRARLEFITGQVHQKIGDTDQAYKYYKKALRYSKSYEMTFYTKLYLAQVTKIQEGTSVKKVEKYFKKLLKDPKNLEYQDKIYYEMGGFELKRGNLAKAIELYKQSISSNINNPRQKSYAFLQLAQIYYDSLADFELAKNYYDSTMAILPRDEKNYEQIKVRQEVLAEFVTHLNTIRTNDSIIALTKIDEDSLMSLVNQTVEAAQELDKKEKAARVKAERKSRISSNNVYNENNQVTISTAMTGDWYFYNNAEVSKGLSDFRRKWGQRTLTDNWRRSDFISQNESTDNTDLAAAESTDEKDEEASKEFDAEAEKNKLLSAIPSSEGEIETLEGEIEVAYYELGKIYNFRLGEKENAILQFNTLLRRFPNSEFEPEVLYQLYLLNDDFDSIASVNAGQTLVSKHPETIFAKLVLNPNYIEDNEALRLALQKVYTRAYNLYQDKQFESSLVLLDSALVNEPDNEFADYLKLLSAMCKGQIDGVYKYQYELNNFIKEHPESELASYAQQLVMTSEEYQTNLFSASRAKYIENFDDEHYMLVLYEREGNLGDTIQKVVTQYVRKKNGQLSTGSLVVDEKYAMVLVNQFDTQKLSMTFMAKYLEDIKYPEKVDAKTLVVFVITKENFEIFYETKDLENYLRFFDKHYLR